MIDKKLIEENSQFLFPERHSEFTSLQSNKDFFPTFIWNDRLHSNSISEILKNDGIDKTYDFIDNQKEFFKDFYEFYSLLFKLIKKNKTEIDNNKQEKSGIIINLNLWGIDYAKKFLRYCLPSLSNENNLIYVNKNYKLIIDLYLDLDSKKHIERELINNKIINSIKFNYNIIDQEIFNCSYYKNYIGKTRYFLYGALQNISIYRAKKMKASLICLTPDNIFSNSFLKNIIQLAEENNYDSIFGSNTLRIQEEGLNDISYKKLVDADFNNESMLEFALKNIHHDFFKHFVCSGNNYFQNTSFLITRTSKGIKMNSFWAHPYFISNSYLDKINTFSFLPLDNKFPIQNNDFSRFKVIDKYKIGFSIDLAKKNNLKIRGKPNLSKLIDFINMEKIDNRFETINNWFFEQTSYLEFDSNFDDFAYFTNKENVLIKKKYNYLKKDVENYDNLIDRIIGKDNNSDKVNNSNLKFYKPKTNNLFADIKKYLKRYDFIVKLNNYRKKIFNIN